jgi:DNA polymerase III epsilon subunit-like protein
VAHNLEFDLNMLKVECMRKIIAIESEHINSGIGVKQIVTRSKQRKYETEHNWYQFLNLLKTKTNFYCTMQESIELCNIKKTNLLGEYLKFPKLSELHETLFKSSPKNLHNSLNDILICLRCFYKLRLNEDLLKKNMEIKKMLENLL